MEALSAHENSERQQTEEKLNRLNVELAQQAAELKVVNQTLLVSEQRLRIAIETGRIGLFVWDSTQLTNPGDWSNQLKEIFGLPLDADVTHDMFLKCVHPDDREHIDQCVMNALKGENGGEYKTEYRTIRPDDGSEHWVTARGQAFFNSEGKAIRFIGTVMDITERKRAEQFLSRVNTELEERISQRVADLSRTNQALQNEIAERNQVEDKLRQSQAYLAEAQKLSLTGSFGWNVSTGEIIWSKVQREMTGLEAWFRSPQNPPPRWKMAVATYLGVVPVIMGLSLTIGPVVRSWNFILNNLVFNACVVALLTWVVMPLITRILHRWLHSK